MHGVKTRNTFLHLPRILNHSVNQQSGRRLRGINWLPTFGKLHPQRAIQKNDDI